MEPPEFHGPRDYLDAAKSELATPEELDRLARSPFVFVDIAVAGNSSTSGGTLTFLLTKVTDDGRGDDLLHALASNPSSPAEVLTEISRRVPKLLHERNRHQGFASGVALTQRSDTPFEALQSMLVDAESTTEFRKVVARDTTRADVIALLRNDRSERVRNAARGNAYALVGDNSLGDLSAGEIDLLVDGLSDDVSFSCALNHLGLRGNPSEANVPPNTALIGAAFVCLERLLRGGLIEIGRIEYVDLSQPRGTLAPVRHVSEPLTVVRDRVESACATAADWSDWAFSCWIVNTERGDEAATHAVARRA